MQGKLLSHRLNVKSVAYIQLTRRQHAIILKHFVLSDTAVDHEALKGGAQTSKHCKQAPKYHLKYME
jgi:hypothetical protein